MSDGPPRMRDGVGERRPAFVAPGDRPGSRRMFIRVLLAVIVLLVVAYFATGMPGMDHEPARNPAVPGMEHGGPSSSEGSQG